MMKPAPTLDVYIVYRLYVARWRTERVNTAGAYLENHAVPDSLDFSVHVSRGKLNLINPPDLLGGEISNTCRRKNEI
jgi:hypothetical protein